MPRINADRPGIPCVAYFGGKWGKMMISGGTAMSPPTSISLSDLSNWILGHITSISFRLRRGGGSDLSYYIGSIGSMAAKIFTLSEHIPYPDSTKLQAIHVDMGNIFPSWIPASCIPIFVARLETQKFTLVATCICSRRHIYLLTDSTNFVFLGTLASQVRSAKISTSKFLGFPGTATNPLIAQSSICDPRRHHCLNAASYLASNCQDSYNSNV
ncbi:hypothetical protein C8R43DRAFT_1107829 [Mycena crocata]|nr:hypothetical protein C8R43DRAFT_1107829 [Mycena crocata]